MLARQIAIGFGIAVVFPLLIYYGVSTFQPAPRWADYSGQPAPAASTPDERKEAAVRQATARKQYDDAARNFCRALILVATPLGIIAIVLGAFLPYYAVGTGLIFGGIFAVATGYWNYWDHLEDWLRFVSLAGAFAVLLFIGFRKLMPATKP